MNSACSINGMQKCAYKSTNYVCNNLIKSRSALINYLLESIRVCWRPLKSIRISRRLSESIGVHWSQLELITLVCDEINWSSLESIGVEEVIMSWNLLELIGVHWSPMESIGVGELDFTWNLLQPIGVHWSQLYKVRSIGVDGVDGVSGDGGVRTEKRPALNTTKIC